MRRFQVTALPTTSGAVVELDTEGSHHLLKVLRGRKGSSFLLFDGSGQEAAATLSTSEEGLAQLTLTEAPHTRPEPTPLHLVMAIVKGPAMDRAVRMATECGVTHIHPVVARHSVARGEKTDRWERIAKSAAQQCGRADVPEVLPVAKLFEALGRLDADVDIRIAQPGEARAEQATGPAAVVIGPEGGFTPDEIMRALDLGAMPIGLGPNILRADTAAAVALAFTAPDAGGPISGSSPA